MRKIILSLAAAAAILTAGSLANRAEAITLGAPAGLAPAIEETSSIEQVHCRPGWRHHYPTRWRRADGCSRVYRGYRAYRGYPYYYGPRVYFGPRYRYRYWRHW